MVVIAIKKQRIWEDFKLKSIQNQKVVAEDEEKVASKNEMGYNMVVSDYK